MQRKSGSELSDDGHHIVIDGRKWRATDPLVPEEVAAELRRHLMAARRAVRDALRQADAEAEGRARARVQMAKTALGERGAAWWEQSEGKRKERWEEGLKRLDEEQS
ncbi:hypothetical protein ACIREE_33660 [Streptomyces sp. NPDC102467]|uniref:hypothetical protein n=1 Tax=Streptomyces sp. NPDC102467 TaxID=3366179 RepID=UPI0037FF3AA4